MLVTSVHRQVLFCRGGALCIPEERNKCEVQKIRSYWLRLVIKGYIEYCSDNIVYNGRVSLSL